MTPPPIPPCIYLYRHTKRCPPSFSPSLPLSLRSLSPKSLFSSLPTSLPPFLPPSSYIAISRWTGSLGMLIGPSPHHCSPSQKMFGLCSSVVPRRGRGHFVWTSSVLLLLAGLLDNCRVKRLMSSKLFTLMLLLYQRLIMSPILLSILHRDIVM